MPAVTSCGVVVLSRRRVFACRATGTRRWDLPKGIADPGETPRAAAVREAWEEAGLRLDPATLHDLGDFAYLRAKRLHLFALHAAEGALDPSRCRCRSFFAHPVTRRPTPEADAFAWQALDALADWSGQGLAKVLAGLDWAALEALPAATAIEVDVASP
jgi:8-oxo-dGTP pyrophosphatase MutT (NUDIX family)